jgi:large subunit ribosomal protein L32e
MEFIWLKKVFSMSDTKKVKKAPAKKTGAIAKMKTLLSKKKTHPTFRGRFGVRSIRRSSIEKFDKWRVPRGIDIKWESGDGTRVTIGYRNPKEIRDVHPSGYREVLVGTVKDLEKVKKESHAARIRGTVSKKKKVLIKAEAEKKGIKVLN